MKRLRCWLFGHPGFGWSNVGIVSSSRTADKYDGYYTCVRCRWHLPVWLAIEDDVFKGVVRRILGSVGW